MRDCACVLLCQGLWLWSIVSGATGVHDRREIGPDEREYGVEVIVKWRFPVFCMGSGSWRWYLPIRGDVAEAQVGASSGRCRRHTASIRSSFSPLHHLYQAYPSRYLGR